MIILIKKKINTFKDGSFKTNVRVMISYRPGPNQKPRQKTIKNFGYLEDYPDQDAFWKLVKETDDVSKKGHGEDMVIVVPKKQKNSEKTNIKYNYGFRFIETILKELKLDTFFESIAFKGKYNLFDIFSFLIYERIINPASKRKNIRHIDYYYQKEFDFELYDVYRALDIFSRESVSLQAHINKQIKRIIGRDQSFAFYDVTNFYFEKDFNGPIDTLCQKGVSKEHRLTPIVQFGLFMDSNNIPVAMKVYPGNTSDSLTLKPALNDVKREFGLGRLVLVADKGLNSASNIDLICNNNDGYVVSQTLKGPKGKRYHDILFDKEGYHGDDDFRYKTFIEQYESHINSKKTVLRTRKVLLYWSKEDALYAKRKRYEKLLKAEKELNNNIYTSTNHANFINNPNIIKQYFVERTGEEATKEVRSVNYSKFQEEEKFDGYFCIITSELDYDQHKILDVYHHLSYIEESFRITKSDLETRPIYLTTDNHIDAHLLTCFVALIVIRMIQHKLKEDKISTDRLKKVLSMCTCEKINDLYIHLNSVSGDYEYKTLSGKSLNDYLSTKINKQEDITRNDFLTLLNKYNIDLDFSFLKINEFNHELKKIKYSKK